MRAPKDAIKQVANSCDRVCRCKEHRNSDCKPSARYMIVCMNLHKHGPGILFCYSTALGHHENHQSKYPPQMVISTMFITLASDGRVHHQPLVGGLSENLVIAVMCLKMLEGCF